MDDWLDFTESLVSAVVWPAVVTFFLWRFRGPLSGILEAIRTRFADPQQPLEAGGFGTYLRLGRTPPPLPEDAGAADAGFDGLEQGQALTEEQVNRVREKLQREQTIAALWNYEYVALTFSITPILLQILRWISLQAAPPLPEQLWAAWGQVSVPDRLAAMFFLDQHRLLEDAANGAIVVTHRGQQMIDYMDAMSQVSPTQPVATAQAAVQPAELVIEGAQSVLGLHSDVYTVRALDSAAQGVPGAPVTLLFTAGQPSTLEGLTDSAGEIRFAWAAPQGPATVVASAISGNHVTTLTIAVVGMG